MGCVPAEPTAVSPDGRNLPPNRFRVERPGAVFRLPNSFGRGKITDMETVTNTTTALNQLLEPLSQTLGVEAALSISGLKIDPAIQTRIEELADRCNEGLLTEAERAEYSGYVEGAEILALIKSKARRYLASHVAG